MPSQHLSLRLDLLTLAGQSAASQALGKLGQHLLTGSIYYLLGSLIRFTYVLQQ